MIFHRTMYVSPDDTAPDKGEAMILYINSCVRRESRTDELARELLSRLGGAYVELKLPEAGLLPLTRERLEQRNELLKAEAYDHPMFDYARQFASADTIVISAPYWDLSFPAELKLYIENIYATGIVSRYGEDGAPMGLCRAQRLYYVTTAGGPYDPAYSFDQISTMATRYFGIGEAKLIKAEMLDIVGNDPRAILERAKAEMTL